jgi:hypothetical protein
MPPQAKFSPIALAVALLASLPPSQPAWAARMGSFYRGATAFRDCNGDGVFQDGEPSVKTGENGDFDPPLSSSAACKTARVYLREGFHIASRQPNPYALQTAPKGAKVVSPLTSIWQSLLDRGRSSGQIQATFQTKLQDANAQLDTNSAKLRKGQQKGVPGDVLSQFTAAIANACYGACANLRAPKATRRSPAGNREDSAIAAVAEALSARGGAVDFTQDQALKAIYDATLQNAQDVTDEDRATTARIAAVVNRLANQAGTSDLIKQVFGIIANAGALLHDRNFAQALQDYVENAQPGTLKPVAPRLSLAPASDSGQTGDNLTNAKTPTLNVEVGAGTDSVTVKYGVTAQGDATRPGDGSNIWTFAVPQLADGAYGFTALARNAQGEAGDESQALTITVDATPPAQPALTSTNPGAEPVGALAGTWSGQDYLSVTVEGSCYEYGGHKNGCAGAGLSAAGTTWILTLNPALDTENSPYNLALYAEDKAGNSSKPPKISYAVNQGSNPHPLPPAPTVAPLTTASASPTISGAWSAGAGQSLKVAVAGKTYTSANGLVLGGTSWSLALSGLAPGTYEVVATVTDGFGQSVADATANELVVQQSKPNPPPAPTVAPLTTASASPTISGAWSAGAGQSLKVAVAGKTYTSANGLVLGGTSWSLALSGLAPGTYEVVATVTDGFGQSVADASHNELLVNAPTQTQPTGALNDTGLTTCGDYAYDGNSGTHNNDLDCDGRDPQGDPIPPGQDALYGRDALAAVGALVKVGAGHAGFDYTKLDGGGNELPASAARWSCVRDNHTGLIWEIKTDDGGLHDKGWTYTWREPDKTKNGGQAGTSDGGSCGKTSRCDTQGFVQAVNAQGWCGHRDWRLPAETELLSLADRSRTNPAIDADYFPETGSGFYWSSSPYAGGGDLAWSVFFGAGYGNASAKDYDFSVRLVRSGQ